ncbi:sulfite oxidase [soil metagenome]
MHTDVTAVAKHDTTEQSAAVPPSTWRAALAGLLAALAALAAGELLAALVDGARSTVTSIGTAVIDLAPPALKDAAIETLGTADKPVLIATVLVVLAVAAMGAGVAAARRLWLGVAGVVGLGLVGLAAAVADPSATGVAAVLPALAAIVAGVGSLWWLMHTLHATTRVAGAGGETTDSGDADTATDDDTGRRAFLQAATTVGGLALGAGVAGRWLIRQAETSTAPATAPFPSPDVTLEPVPADASLGVDGVTPFVTPNADFYRIDTALQVPTVNVDQWTLRIHGMVDNPIELTYDELLDNEVVEADITLACVSNEIGGDLVGNARWRGIRLADVLDKAGVQSGADQLVGRSVDGFTAGSPVETVLDGRESLIAIGMNGAPLPRIHGFPARLVVPGLYGYVSATKWLTELELTTFDAFDAYWIPRGWAAQAPIKTQSRIDVPRPLTTIAPGTVAVAGVAWAQTRGITKVEVKVDDGPWEETRLSAEVGKDTWRQWVYEWEASPGRHELRVRATDSTGEPQPADRVPPRPDGATGRHNIIVTVADN